MISSNLQESTETPKPRKNTAAHQLEEWREGGKSKWQRDGRGRVVEFMDVPRLPPRGERLEQGVLLPPVLGMRTKGQREDSRSIGKLCHVSVFSPKSLQLKRRALWECSQVVVLESFPFFLEPSTPQILKPMAGCIGCTCLWSPSRRDSQHLGNLPFPRPWSLKVCSSQ